MATSPSGFVDRVKGKSKSDQNFYSVQTGIIAHAGGGQANAVALTAQNCFIATVATIADSVRLPAAQAGMEITVVNQAALAAATFPSTGDTINGGAANASVALPTGTAGATPVVIFYCGIQGAWWTK